ncbi:MAG: DUF3821 domain-containing protein, partial [Methanomicrobium sp.]|nr:DUF3821 domain-containing protein [Methanomicrobium sp.]
DDVFYGNDTKIAYFGSGKTTGAPGYVYSPSKTGFPVLESTFMDKQGAWYSYPEGTEAGHVAFYVDYPQINMRLYAYRGGDSFDITNGKIVSGETLDFRIDSNLAPIFSRTGVTGSDEGIDIVFTNSFGATLTSLYDCNGVPVSIVNLHPTTSSFYAPDGSLTCLWDTGNSAYKAGDYTIYAKVNVNNIFNNLGSIQGVTVSPTLSTKTKTEDLSMGVNTPTPTPTPIPSVSTSPGSKTANPTVKPTVKPTATPTPKPTENTQAPAATVTETPTITQVPTETPASPLGMDTLLTAVILGIVALAVLRKD